ncbi:ABC transporter ATP-binding protein [Fusibacter paucivorans]|uniref:ABC transporter ATP-binding protein n=1 Tax=Fusibacter paucivorans TaxID=76009 RepID=A0ABS5PUC0_9FIRM|nr:ABC transporter ATP-binding protein [Fusibacter paucivorans]MBS7527961.1 ABC transporter ATP-binding protein [Fusibacter paucivorans]
MIKQMLNVLTVKGKAMIAAATLAFTMSGLLSTYLMYVIVNVINQGHIDRSRSEMTVLCMLLFAILLLKAGLVIAADMTKHFAGFAVVAKVRESIIRKLKRFSLAFYSKERLGEISTIIHKDVDRLESLVGHFFSVMFSDIIIALILGVWLFTQSLALGLAMIALLPIAVLMLVLGLKRSLLLQKQTNDDLVDMASLFIEYVRSIPLIKAFSENVDFEEKLQNSIRKFGTSAKKQSKAVAIYVGSFSIFFELAYAVMMIAGAVMLYYDMLAIKTFLIFIIFSHEFYKPIGKIEKYWINFLQVKDSYQRVSKILEAPEMSQIQVPQKAGTFEIAYEKVNFAYASNEFALKDVSFELPQGSITALVGPSGSGKTTVANLLLRFWDNESGAIKIGGVDIREMDYDDLLSNISIVMQQVVIFADSIYENIKLGNRNATRAQVMAAAKKAQIHDFIVGLPNGYDTIVGENGVGLSGGQRQRISIARAFVKNAPIVVLDEMTSNVDPVNEVKIQRALSTLAKGRTVMVIAHHLHTIRSADKILVFNAGELVEQGTHESLLKREGLYRQLWQVQASAKEWEFSM